MEIKIQNKNKITVLVTGFGPFRSFKVNPSWEAVKLIPELFSAWEKSSDINLVIEEIPVAYNHVSDKIKELWEKHKPMIIVHVGVSHLAQCLVIECQASNKGYDQPDIFDKYPVDNSIDYMTLKTTCDTEKICETINENSDATGCRACISLDAGRYLCEYIYYQSLNIGKSQVIFIHVPDLNVYPSAKTAKGLFEIIIYLIDCLKEEKCNEKIE